MSELLSLYLCLHSYLSFSVWLSLSICLTLPSCISESLSFFNPYLFFNLFSLCGSLPLMFLFLPRCLSFFLSLCPTPVCLDISPSLFFSPSISLSLSLSAFLFPFPLYFYLSFFLSLSLFLPHLSIFLSPIPVTLSFYVFSTPFSLFLSVSLFYHPCVSLYYSLSPISVFFDNISQILRVLASSTCIYWSITQLTKTLNFCIFIISTPKLIRNQNIEKLAQFQFWTIK